MDWTEQIKVFFETLTQIAVYITVIGSATVVIVNWLKKRKKPIEDIEEENRKQETNIHDLEHRLDDMQIAIDVNHKEVLKLLGKDFNRFTELDKHVAVVAQGVVSLQNNIISGNSVEKVKESRDAIIAYALGNKTSKY